MKVAFATTTGALVDEHFGQAGTFAIYNITPDGASLLELRAIADGSLDMEVVATRGMGSLHDDAVSAKIEKLADAKIICFTEIGGPSAAKLVSRGIMPLKREPGAVIADEADRLATTMRERPAPWMRRAIAEEADGTAATPGALSAPIEYGGCSCDSHGTGCCN